MITTLAVLAYVCMLSLFFVIVIPPLAPTRLFMHFLPQDIRDAAKEHPDPPKERRVLGYLLTRGLCHSVHRRNRPDRRGRAAPQLRLLADLRAVYAVFVRI